MKSGETLTVMLCIVALTSIPCAEAHDTQHDTGVRIEGVGRFGDHPSEVSNSINTRILLNGGMYSTQCLSTGAFAIQQVPPGSYLLEVIHPTLVFQPVLVDVGYAEGSSRTSQQLQTSAYLYSPEIDGATVRQMSRSSTGALRRLKYPLGLSPGGEIEIFEGSW
eukprot:GHVN01055074.1.p1 GENE.GHVN01055074.1~~GHVN01055074.1.p1  ORF type:complete len:164 (+),score=28.53 GHVN01055074.1:156-647(+)